MDDFEICLEEASHAVAAWVMGCDVALIGAGDGFGYCLHAKTDLTRTAFIAACGREGSKIGEHIWAPSVQRRVTTEVPEPQAAAHAAIAELSADSTEKFITDEQKIADWVCAAPRSEWLFRDRLLAEKATETVRRHAGVIVFLANKIYEFGSLGRDRLEYVKEAVAPGTAKSESVESNKLVAGAPASFNHMPIGSIKRIRIGGTARLQ